MAYLGALRYLAEIPQELIDKVTVYMEQTVAGCIESETNIDNITVLSDGRIALACHMEVEYYDAQSDTRQGDSTWFLACLTEPVEGHGDLGVTSHAESEMTEPVTTEHPTETESQIDFNDVPEFVKLGYLNVLVYDQAGGLVYRMSAEALENVENKLYLDYVSGGTVVVEFYAAYNRSQKVSQYRCEGYNATMERIDVSEINSDVTVDVQADYYHYLRMTVQMDALQIKEGTVRENGFVLIGDHGNSNIEGWAMWKRLYICSTTELLDLDEVHHPSYEDYLALKASVDAEWLPMTEVVKIMGKPHGYDSAAGMRIFVWNTADGGQVCAWLSSGKSEPMQWNEILTADYGNARVTSVVYYGSLEQQ